jgi:hypothetical protein
MRAEAIKADSPAFAAKPDLHAPIGRVLGLVWAFRIHDDGRAESLPTDQPIDSRHEGWLRLYLDLANVGRA